MPLSLHWLFFGPAHFGAAEWLSLFGHFLLLSLLAVGGALTTAPDMQRYVVGERQWLTEAQFSAGVALAQAAPGPNVLFVAVIGFQIAGFAGAFATLVGTLLPSTVLALRASRWSARHAESRLVRSLHAGLAPLTIGLLLATGWVLFEPFFGFDLRGGAATLLAVGGAALVVGTRRSPLWPIAAGALLGALGWVG
jgi:chromate transporter